MKHIFYLDIISGQPRIVCGYCNSANINYISSGRGRIDKCVCKQCGSYMERIVSVSKLGDKDDDLEYIDRRLVVHTPEGDKYYDA